MEQLDIQSLASYEVQSTASQNSGGNSARQLVQANAKDNVKVIIRVRPFNEKEKSVGGSKKCVSIENQGTVILETKPDYKIFNFDFVGDEDLDQKTIFDQIAKPIADCCLQGYNGSIFAYGQTGSGKTFTIQGPNVTVNGEEKIAFTLQKEKPEYEKRGLMPRSFEYIFECIEGAKRKASDQNDHFEYLIRCTYLEIYNEQIMDLLEPGSFNLHIREDIKKGVYVEGLLEENVQNAHDMMELIARGAKNRHMGSTSMNKESSRSHSVLTTIIETKSMSNTGVWNLKTSRFHIIDLAGSERAKHTNAIGDRLKEAGMINKSLSALGNVINSLVDISEGKNRHVHYRDSKLTFLLRDSLGGNSKTVIIANISPSSINSGETLSTLKFAQRAKLIKNKAVINEDSSGTIQLLKSEIVRLKKELAESEQRSQSLGQQCAFCKNNIRQEYNTADPENDESMLTDDLADEIDLLNNSAQLGTVNENLKKKFIDSKHEAARMKKRVVYLESLLTANLDNMTSQQKFYEQDIQKNQLLVKKYQQSMEAFEKQCTRDKMIIKFREDRIAKLEQNLPVTKDDKIRQIEDMKKELAILKDGIDHNPQTAKLFSEKAELQVQVNKLQKELNQTPDSMHAQIRSLTELNESLSEYLKQYCEDKQKDFENEIAKLKQEHSSQEEELRKSIEAFLQREQEYQTKYTNSQQQWQLSIQKSKQQIEKLNLKFQQEKIQIEQINKEQIDKIKLEIETVNVNKNEQENTAQMLKIQIIETEKQYLNQVKQLDEKIIELQELQKQSLDREANLQEELTQQQQNLQNLQQQKSAEHNEMLQVMEAERQKNVLLAKHAEEHWLKKLKEQEKEMLDAQNEMQIIDQQCAQLDSRILALVEENEALQQSLLYKEEELLDLQRKIKESQENIINLEVQTSQDQQDFNTLKEQSSQQLQALSLQTEYLQHQQDILEQDIKNLNNINESQLKELNETKEQIISIDQQKIQQQKAQDDIINELKQDKEQLAQKIDNYAQQILLLNQNIESIQIQQEQQNQKSINALLEQKKNNEEQINAFNNEKEQLQYDFTNQQEQLSAELQNIQQQHEQLQEDFSNSKDKFNLYIQTLLTDHQQQLHQLTASNEQQVKKIVQENQETVNMIQDDNTKKICLIQQQAQFECKDIEEQSKQEKIKLQDLYAAQTKEQKESFQQQYDLQQNQYEADIKDLCEKYELQINNLLENNESQLNNSQFGHSNEIQNLQSAHQRQLQDLSSKIQQKIEELEIHNNTLLNDQQIVHENKLGQLRSSLQSQVYQLQEELNLLQETIVTQTNKHNEDILYLNQKHEKQITQDIQYLNQQKLDELGVIGNSFEQIKDDLASQIQVLQKQLEQSVSFHQGDMQLLNSAILSKDKDFQELKNQLNNTETLLQAQIQQLQYQKERQVQDLENVIEEKNNSIKIIGEDLEIKNKHIINLNNQIELIEGQIKALKEQLSHSEVSGIHQQLKITQLNEQILSLIEKESIQVSNNEQIQSNLDAILNQLIQTQEQEMHIQIKYEKLVELMQQKDQEILSQKQIIKDLTCSNAQVDNQQKDALQQIKQIELQKQQLIQQNDKIVLQLKDLRSKLENQKQQFDQQDNISKKQISELISELQKQKESFESQVQQLDIENQDYLQTLEDQQQNSIEQYSSQIQAKQNKINDLNTLTSKQKQQNDEQAQVIRENKNTIKAMIDKESSLLTQLDNKINELSDQQANWKIKMQESKDQRDQLRKEQEKTKKENENLRELVKLKERQIEDLRDNDGKDRETFDQVRKENKELKTQLTKREFEMKEVVRTLKFYSEEKSRMEKELEKLHRENDQLIGHKNPSQKIQHHLKIKEENNKLREDNFKLLDEIRKKDMVLQKTLRGSAKDIAAQFSTQSSYDTTDYQTNNGANKELTDNIGKVIDHIIAQPGLIKIIGLAQDNLDRLQQQSAVLKLKNIMDILSLLSGTLQSKERDIKDLMVEKKRAENKYDISEQEKNLIKQQLELIQMKVSSSDHSEEDLNFQIFSKQQLHTMRNNYTEQIEDEDQLVPTSAYGTSSSVKPGNGSGGLERQLTMTSQKQSSSNKLQIYIQSPHELKSSSTSIGGGTAQVKPPNIPLGNIKIGKEKENITIISKRDIAGGSNRGGSSRRSAYLSNK